jgi:hypothetical protein
MPKVTDPLKWVNTPAARRAFARHGRQPGNARIRRIVAAIHEAVAQCKLYLDEHPEGCACAWCDNGLPFTCDGEGLRDEVRFTMEALDRMNCLEGESSPVRGIG